MDRYCILKPCYYVMEENCMHCFPLEQGFIMGYIEVLVCRSISLNYGLCQMK